MSRRRDARRWEFNEKVKDLIQRGNLTAEERRFIKESFTGSGGLVSNRFGTGQYFTPSNVVKMIHRILGIKPGDRVADLSCGAGAFFDGLEGCQLYGIELDNTAATVSSVLYPNALIVRGDALEHFEQLTEQAYGRVQGLMDHGVGNPPFGLSLPGKWHHRNMKFSKSVEIDLEMDEEAHAAFRSSLIDSAAAFVEMTVRVVKPGGMIGLVVPEGILNANVHDQLRKWLFQECIVTAVISLPVETFYFSGTSVKTSVLIMRKKWPGWEQEVVRRYGLDGVGADGEANYSVLMAVLDCLGWDKRGRTVYWSDNTGHEVKHYTTGERVVRDETLTIPMMFQDGWLLPESEAPRLYEGNGLGADVMMDAMTMHELGFKQVLPGRVPDSVDPTSRGPGYGVIIRKHYISTEVGRDDLEVLREMVAQDEMDERNELNAWRAIAMKRLFQARPSEDISLEDFYEQLRIIEQEIAETTQKLKDQFSEIGFPFPDGILEDLSEITRDDPRRIA